MADETTRERPEPIRVLIANEPPAALQPTASIVQSLGHSTITSSVNVAAIAELTRSEQPDVALVGIGDDSEQALQLIEQIVRTATCPVIALLSDTLNPQFINQAARRGIFAYILDTDAESLQAELDIVLRRFAEYHNLESAFARRAVIERAKGILMATHSLDEQEAFELLRSHSQHQGRKLVDVARAITESHRLLNTRAR